MNTKHTPGPWKYQNDIEMIVSTNPEWNFSSICKLATGEDSSQEIANARLLAVAPELLEALNSILDLLEEGTAVDANRYSTSNAEKRVFDAARAAIAKAIDHAQ